MRVLVVNDLPLEDGPGTGGAEIYARRVASGLRDAGDVVDVFTRPGPRSRWSRPLTLWDPAVRRAFRRRVREFRPDVIHFHNVFRELSGSVLGASPDVPAVMSVHDPRVVGITLGDISAVTKVIDRRVKRPIDTAEVRRHIDLLLPVSHTVDGWLRDAGFTRTREIPVPVNEPVAALAPPSASLDVVVVARLAAEKGFDVLMAAWHDIVAAVPDARLRIVGDGPQRSWVEAEASRVPNVELLGWLGEDDVSRVLATARVVVSPVIGSRLPQASSIVAVESAMHGRPFVGSTEPAIVGLIDSLGHGFAGAPGDAAAVTEYVVRILREPELADELGAAGRATAMRRHTIAAVAAEVRHAYVEAMT